MNTFYNNDNCNEFKEKFKIKDDKKEELNDNENIKEEKENMEKEKEKFVSNFSTSDRINNLNTQINNSRMPLTNNYISNKFSNYSINSINEYNKKAKVLIQALSRILNKNYKIFFTNFQLYISFDKVTKTNFNLLYLFIQLNITKHRSSQSKNAYKKQVNEVNYYTNFNFLFKFILAYSKIV